MDVRQEVKTGILYMVDLAGSERAAVTKVTSAQTLNILIHSFCATWNCSIAARSLRANQPRKEMCIVLVVLGVLLWTFEAWRDLEDQGITSSIHCDVVH